MPRTTTARTTGQHVIRQAREACTREWGERAFAQMGPRLQRALLAEAVLNIATGALVPDAETATRIAREGVSEVIQATPAAFAA